MEVSGVPVFLLGHGQAQEGSVDSQKFNSAQCMLYQCVIIYHHCLFTFLYFTTCTLNNTKCCINFCIVENEQKGNTKRKLTWYLRLCCV